jgi:hypothetical protein
MTRRRSQETPVPQQVSRKCVAIDLPVGHVTQIPVKQNFFFYEKFFASAFRNIMALICASRLDCRGALRIVTKREAGCDGRASACDERGWSGRQSRVVLTPPGWR